MKGIILSWKKLVSRWAYSNFILSWKNHLVMEKQRVRAGNKSKFHPKKKNVSRWRKIVVSRWTKMSLSRWGKTTCLSWTNSGFALEQKSADFQNLACHETVHLVMEKTGFTLEQDPNLTLKNNHLVMKK